MKTIRMKGFTLIEMVVTVAILGIITAVGVPSFGKMIKNGKQSTAHSALITDLSYARSEAVKRSTYITLCAKSSDTECSGSANWSDGWLIFLDPDQDNEPNTDDDILIVSESLKGGITISQINFPKSGSLTYHPRGNAEGRGAFTLCDDRGVKRARAVNVTQSGSTRNATDTDDDDVVETQTGANVEC